MTLSSSDSYLLMTISQQIVFLKQYCYQCRQEILFLNTVEKLYHGKKQREDHKPMKSKVEMWKIELWKMCQYYLWCEFHYFLWFVAGLRDAFIISLNGSESIDASKKGSLARFINHSWWAIWCSVIYTKIKY